MRIFVAVCALITVIMIVVFALVYCHLNVMVVSPKCYESVHNLITIIIILVVTVTSTGRS